MALPPIPSTPVEERIETLHGIEVSDPYRWLENGGDPRVAAWSQAQDARARAYLGGLPERPDLARRLGEALDCGALSVIVPRGPYLFFTRRLAGMNQAALYVVGPDGRERVLVDPAPLSDDSATALDWWHPSPTGALVAYGISEAGDEDSTLHVIETASGRLLEDRIRRCRLASVAFEPGERALLYTRLPHAGEVAAGDESYYRRVYRHVLGQDSARDELVLARARKTDFPGGISISRSGKHRVVNVSLGWGESLVCLQGPEGPFQTIFEVASKEAHAWFAGDRLLAITNLDAPNYRLVEIDLEAPAPERWVTLVAESEHVLLDAAACADRLLLHHLVDCSSRLREVAPDGSGGRDLDLPELSTVTGLGASEDLADAYAAVERFTHPAAVYRLSANQGAAVVQALRPPEGFEADRHPVRQAWCTSADGTAVHLFLVGRVGGHGTAVLHGYGGFNVVKSPVWSPALVPLLERGGLFVVANLRGGAEYGERWHRGGMRAQKQRTFDDFIAAGEWLVEQGLTSPERLGIFGHSNGGLLVGAAVTQRPDLWGAAWCGVPLLDMLRYEHFQVAQLWASEYGSAADPEQFGWLHGYSPYHRLREAVRYPPLLLTTAAGDTRVDPMHARKFAARLQALSPESLTLLRVEERAGHGQGKPASKVLEEAADAWAFLLHHLDRET